MTTQNDTIVTLPLDNSDQQRHCMVDIETFGNGNRSVITSIGAVALSIDTNEADFGLFYVTVDPSSCSKIGMEMDASTIQWWLKQSDEARAAISHDNGLPIEVALGMLHEWYKQCQCKELWGNGATFDNVILDSAYRLAADADKTHAGKPITPPWGFREHSCYRTLRKHFPNCQEGIENTVKHHALSDAIYQAKILQRILKKIAAA
jgi:hypothetical protein